MTNIQNKDQRTTAWETHFSTIATALILAAIMFTGGAMYSFGTKLAEYGIAQQFSNEKLTELSEQLKADRAGRVDRQDFVELRDRVRILERKAYK